MIATLRIDRSKHCARSCRVEKHRSTVVFEWRQIRRDHHAARRRNSEIYNHEDLHKNKIDSVDMNTTSDSAVLGYWFDKEGKITHEMLDSLDGIFATTVLDERTGHFVAARDPMGICPMYWGKGADGSTWFASEMKALHDVCETFDIFPPVRAQLCLVACGRAWGRSATCVSSAALLRNTTRHRMSA